MPDPFPAFASHHQPHRAGPKAVSREDVIAELGRIVVPAQVLTSARDTRRYTRGFRYGGGPVAAVVRPGSLVEQWRVLNAVIVAGRIVIYQAANTGLTGGSAPWGEDYDREIVLVSLRRLKGIRLIDGGRQVVCLPGATLDALEKALRPLGREPHSVIGSSCIGASVLGGIFNNSGGALIQRGPAYTELSLYAEVRADGSVALVNHLGLALGNDPEEISAAWNGANSPRPRRPRHGPPTATTWPMSATLWPKRRPGSTQTPAACARLPAAPASSRCSPCA